MSPFVYFLSMTLPLLALIELAVGGKLLLRNERSSHLSKYQQEYPQLYKNERQLNLDDIFTVGTENGLVLFNTTPKPSGHNNPPKINAPPAETMQNENEYDCKERREGKPYCLNVPNYLELTQLNKISKTEFTRFEALFGEDVIIPLNITHRMNDEPDDIYHCDSKATTIYPRQGETRSDGWMYIVNNDVYKQGVLVELCNNAGMPCKFSDSLPSKYSSMCKQHYIYRVLVAVHPNQTMTKEHFKIPSCCKCALRQHGF